MTTDDLIQSAILGVVVTLVAFETAAAAQAWIANRPSDRPSRSPVLWLSRKTAIRSHLAGRRREFDSVRWQYPVLRSSRHGHQVRDTIRRLVRPALQGQGRTARS